MDVRNQKGPIMVFLEGVFANFNEKTHQDHREHNQELVRVCGRGDGGRCASPSKYVCTCLKHEARSQ